MTRVVDSYLATRLEVLASRLIAMEDLPGLVDAPLEELLKRFNYDHETKQGIHRVNNHLISQALLDFELLFRPFHGIQRELLNYAVHWYELSNLKTLIRGKFTGKPESMIAQELIDLESFNVLPLRRLLETDDPLEMMRLLEDTPYASIARQARNIYEEEGQNLFSLDAAIDRLFFSGLMQRIRFLDFADRQPLTELFGTIMDRLNLVWLIRYRFSYNLSPAKSYYLLVTTGKKIHSGNLMKLAKMDNLADLIDHLPEPLNQLLHDRTDLTNIENIVNHYVSAAAIKTLKYSPSVITRVFAYVQMRESEIHFLHAVIKGKALDFDQSLIMQASGANWI